MLVIGSSILIPISYHPEYHPALLLPQIRRRKPVQIHIRICSTYTLSGTGRSDEPRPKRKKKKKRAFVKHPKHPHKVLYSSPSGNGSGSRIVADRRVIGSDVYVGSQGGKAICRSGLHLRQKIALPVPLSAFHASSQACNVAIRSGSASVEMGVQLQTRRHR
jgi:hypothetical protein